MFCVFYALAAPVDITLWFMLWQPQQILHCGLNSNFKFISIPLLSQKNTVYLHVQKRLILIDSVKAFHDSIIHYRRFGILGASFWLLSVPLQGLTIYGLLSQCEFPLMWLFITESLFFDIFSLSKHTRLVYRSKVHMYPILDLCKQRTIARTSEWFNYNGEIISGSIRNIIQKCCYREQTVLTGLNQSYIYQVN